jgi:hypothetical protein
MPKVNTEHKDYQAASPLWARCRDCYAGGDAVKGAGERYLPMLDAYRGMPDSGARYAAFVKRSMFYNAVARTVDGLAGSIFQKELVVEVPASVEDHFEDVTLTDVPLELAALFATREVLKVGRYGVLVDMSSGSAELARPYWAPYHAEDIVNWRTERVNGDPTLTLVVLRENGSRVSEKDPYEVEEETTYRTLHLESGAYLQRRWEKLNTGLWQQIGPDVEPLRRGAPLPFIPFVFFGPTSIQPDIEKPPLLDLVDVNLSHYVTIAHLEHGRYYTALPTPWVAGASGASMKDDGPVSLGPGVMMFLEKGGQAGMLEFTGQGLGSLERADVEKRKLMATLGARLLEEQVTVGETMGAVAMRHSGEHATLRTVAATVEQGLTALLRIHSWWAAGSAERTPRDVDARVELNKDFFAVKMTGDELRSWVLAYQGGTVSFATFWAALIRGQVARPVEAEEELRAIREENQDAEPMPNAADPNDDPNADPNADPVPPPGKAAPKGTAAV